MTNDLAANPYKSIGRLFRENDKETNRTSFERDRDRNIKIK